MKVLSSELFEMAGQVDGRLSVTEVHVTEIGERRYVYMAEDDAEAIVALQEHSVQLRDELVPKPDTAVTVHVFVGKEEVYVKEIAKPEDAIAALDPIAAVAVAEDIKI